MESVLDTSQSHSANGKFSSFIADVEELTHALRNDVETPDIARVKAKVRIALAAARSALADGATQVRSQALAATKTTDTYVRDNPWQVVGIAALIGLAVGIFATRRTD